MQQGIEAAGGKVVVAIGDLSTDNGAQRVVDTAVAECGASDILVNNRDPGPNSRARRCELATPGQEG